MEPPFFRGGVFAPNQQEFIGRRTANQIARPSRLGASPVEIWQAFKKINRQGRQERQGKAAELNHDGT
jgi:hypothetical protein